MAEHSTVRCHICGQPMRLELGEGFEGGYGHQPPTVVWACTGCGLWRPAALWAPPGVGDAR